MNYFCDFKCADCRMDNFALKRNEIMYRKTVGLPSRNQWGRGERRGVSPL